MGSYLIVPLTYLMSTCHLERNGQMPVVKRIHALRATPGLYSAEARLPFD